MNIDKIEQEYDWFMSDEDNQLHLLRYLPELLAEVKRLREVVDKQQMQYVNLETAYYNSPSEIEVKRLREVIKRIKDCATINAQHDDTLNEEWEHILELIE